jgi:hypothetical protein
MFGVLKRIVSRSGDGKQEGQSTVSAVKNLLTKGPLQHAIPLSRQDDVLASLKLQAGDCESSQTGSAMLDGKALSWREFIWSRDTELDQCRWHSVRWRFYENGLICFDALMSNSSEHLDLGDLQGHRIELREKNGFLLGIWAAGFYVRRGLTPLGFQANIVDDHVPLKMHFSEISDKQSGQWLRR